ncbi:hypothetical protein K3495_g16195 [Podosphaera aphanis]|nr:hypothetical protein K3495_g16195 [Podosphaera aphanis]
MVALMNAIDQEFPLAKNILCFWHIKMVFQSFLGKGLYDDGIKFFTQDFMEVVHATTVADFSERWSSCSAKWTVVHPYGQQVVTYLKDTWLPYADGFVHCHIKGHLHLGHLTTRKVEGTHHYVKMFIGDSTGHLLPSQKGSKLRWVSNIKDTKICSTKNKARELRVAHFTVELTLRFADAP